MASNADDIKSAVASAQADLGVNVDKGETLPESPVGQGAKVEAKAAPEPEAKPEPVAKVDKAEEPEPEPKPKKEAAKAEPEPEEELDLAAEDIEAIDADPRLRKAYKSMLRDYRKKTTTVAEQRKALDDKSRIVDLMTEDPDGALRALAAIRGVKLAEPAEKVAAVRSEVDEALAQLEAVIGPEGTKVLRPVFEAVTKQAVERIAQERIAPLEAKAQEFGQAALAQSIDAGLAKFRATIAEQGGEWDDEIENDMAGLLSKVRPAEGATFDEYVEVLYNNAVKKQDRVKTARERVARLKAAAAKQEPGRPARPAVEAPTGITRDMPQADAIKLAVQLAQKELGSR